MSKYEHNPELPFVVEDTNGDEAARFRTLPLAKLFYASFDLGATIINTTPAPEKAGIYRLADANGVSSRRHPVRSTRGEWFWLDITAKSPKDMFQPMTEGAIERHGYRLVPVFVEA